MLNLAYSDDIGELFVETEGHIVMVYAKLYHPKSFKLSSYKHCLRVLRELENFFLERGIGCYYTVCGSPELIHWHEFLGFKIKEELPDEEYLMIRELV